MHPRFQAFLIIFALAILFIIPLQASAVDLDGESSKVTVRSRIIIDSDGMMKLTFQVLWGESEFEESNIFRPRVVPPVLPWTDLSWENLSTMITPISTIRYLFESPLTDGRTIVASENHFIETVLDIDVSFSLQSVETRILAEFDMIEIQSRLEPSESSYTISPLKFLSELDFHGYPPLGEVEIETGPSIMLQSSSFALNHFLLPEGHRFSSKGLFSVEDDRITYDTSEDSIHVRKLPLVISATLLYSVWIGAAFLSMVMLSVAGRRAKKRINKGAEMWFAIGAVCFFAFLPYHLYLSLILIIIGFYYSAKKSQDLKPAEKPSSPSKDEHPLPREDPSGLMPKEQAIGERPQKAEEPLEPLQSEELTTLIPPPVPLVKTTIDTSDPSFTPPSDFEGNDPLEKANNDPYQNLESGFSRSGFPEESGEEISGETENSGT